MRDVGIAEKRDPVRAEFDGPCKASFEIAQSLAGKPVHQVEIERPHASLPQDFDALFDERIRAKVE